jgi:hypothetical protein
VAEKKTKAGRKKAFGIIVDFPPLDPPTLTKAPEVAAYRSLRKLLTESPFCTAAMTEAIEQAARLKVRIERLREAVDALESEVIEREQGTYIHPLVKQLHAAEVSYRVSLGALTLTPKSIASSRLTAGQRGTLVPGAQGDEPEKPSRKPSGKRARVLKMMGLTGEATQTG